jgi:CRISPR-associated endonuclease/helicase Cas3
MTLYAHSLPSQPDATWEPLDAHLDSVADKACQLAAKFGAGEWGLSAGLLHDIGKAKPGFQSLLRGGPPEPHAAEGARFAIEHYDKGYPRPFNEPLGRLLSFAIAGHHAGLANGRAGGSVSPLNERLKQAADVSAWFTPKGLPKFEKMPHPLVAAKRLGHSGKPEPDPFGWAFFTRMLFSALVDADRLETERWYADQAKEKVARGWDGTLLPLKQALDLHLAGMASDARAIDRLRAEVLADGRTAASQVPGLFSLTVPTGGGKTLSSLTFALEHAIAHKLDRVIYVIPFTSIVEQTAEVFRTALGKANADAILEHHSGFEVDGAVPGAKEEDERVRLAAQNWDRPIIVTTAVQFFESLFSNRTGRCRKLHNIARSVVVLDEAQTLPLHLLRPCLAAINELSRGYKTSLVLCTATQPALTKEAGLKAPEALVGVREIVAPDRDLFARLRRVRTVQAGTLSDTQLVEALREADQTLVIVNNRRHARELFELLAKSGLDGVRHLTTAMTAAHRQYVLADIRNDLKDGRPVRLVSTSLIEAGVDVSFKAVWRAWAGLDQLAQAAGRCNRNGELGPEGGVLTIFEPEEIEGRKPPRELEANAETAKRVLAQLGHLDPLSHEAVALYFKELLWTKDDGGKLAALDNVKVGETKILGIMKALDESAPGLNFRFADIADAFRMIDDVMVPVIIPASAHAIAGAPADVINALTFAKSAGGIARSLQRHIVQIPRSARGKLIATKAAHFVRPNEFGDQFALLDNGDIYRDMGLDWSDPSFRTIEGGII